MHQTMQVTQTISNLLASLCLLFWFKLCTTATCCCFHQKNILYHLHTTKLHTDKVSDQPNIQTKRKAKRSYNNRDFRSAFRIYALPSAVMDYSKGGNIRWKHTYYEFLKDKCYSRDVLNQTVQVYLTKWLLSLIKT